VRVPLVAGATNAVAALALALFVLPGADPSVDVAQRAAFIREHELAWRVTWSLWMLAGVSLFALLRWWARQVELDWVARAALGMAAVGLVFDLVSDALYIAQPRADLLPLLSLAGAIGANGLYSVAGVLLTLRSRGPGGLARAWTWAVWLAGIALAASAALGLASAQSASAALLFVLFCPWCFFVAPRLR
jgi:hypothetical protein